MRLALLGASAAAGRLGAVTLATRSRKNREAERKYELMLISDPSGHHASANALGAHIMRQKSEYGHEGRVRAVRARQRTVGEGDEIHEDGVRHDGRDVRREKPHHVCLNDALNIMNQLCHKV